MSALPSNLAVADPRVQDFLQDKFQTLSDIDSLDSLLASVNEHQQLLRSQLVAAESASSTARVRLEGHSNALEAAVWSFNARQADIDRRLLATTSAETASTAAQCFSNSIEKLRRLDVAREYVMLLQEIQCLSASARKNIDSGDPEAALIPYTKLQNMSQGLKTRHEAAEDAAANLVEFVEQTVGRLWDDMKKRLSTELEDVLKTHQWPKEHLDFGNQGTNFKQAFDKLLVLQGSELEQHKQAVLLPFEVMVRPLALRFRFHFEGKRQTNRADKPEWFLSHITTLITTYSHLMIDVIQPILTQSPDPNINQRDAINEFITALLPELRRKVHSLLPDIMEQAQLLSHFIHEMIKFDAALREDFGYSPYSSEGTWKGITHEVLVVEGGFDGWIHVEKEFALGRYETIISASDAWQIDYDSVDTSDCKPTKSAMRLKDLLDTITETYRPLISFSQRLRFLMDVQIAILDQYHDRLDSSIEAFRVLSSTIASYVQGSSKQEMESFSGLGGLERLCRVYGSSMYLENAMRDWNDDIFFLELWEDLSTRANLRKTQATISPKIPIRQAADKTSENLRDDGALFDDTASSYARLRSHTEAIISDLISNTVTAELKPYTRAIHWSSTSGLITDGSITPELEVPLATIGSFVSFLSRALSKRVVKRVIRTALARIEQCIHENVIMRHQFSPQGAAQLRHDLDEIWRVATLGNVDVREAWGAKGLEVVRLLTLEASELKEIVKVVMKGAEEATECLERLGISERGLDVRDVRDVVGRRVDAWGT